MNCCNFFHKSRYIEKVYDYEKYLWSFIHFCSWNWKNLDFEFIFSIFEKHSFSVNEIARILPARFYKSCSEWICDTIRSLWVLFNGSVRKSSSRTFQKHIVSLCTDLCEKSYNTLKIVENQGYGCTKCTFLLPDVYILTSTFKFQLSCQQNSTRRDF